MNSRFSGFTSDNAGHFHLRTQPNEMTLYCENAQGGYLKQQEADAQTVDVQEGKTVTVTVNLLKGLSVTGTVTDGEGKPAAGVEFYINMPSGAGGQWSRNDTPVSLYHR